MKRKEVKLVLVPPESNDTTFFGCPSGRAHRIIKVGRIGVVDAVKEWAKRPCGDLVLEGKPERHLDDLELQKRMADLGNLRGLGPYFLDGLVLRSSEGVRIQPQQNKVTVQGGLDGDRWQEGKANPTDQISMMNVNIAHAIANGQSVGLFGDNLFTGLDLSEEALPVGAQITVGEVRLELSEQPHVPCGRFRARFGAAAFEMAARNPRIRGVYLTVISGGTIHLGDEVSVVDPFKAS